MDTALTAQRVKFLGAKISRLNPYVLWFVLLLLVLFKTGFRSSSLGVSVNFIPPMTEMPIASSQFQSGFGPFWIAYLLKIDTTQSWIVMTSLVFFLAVGLVVPLAKRRFPGNVQLAIVLVAALPVLSTQLSWIGMYDPFIFLGLLIWGLGKSRLAWLLGGFIAASANPEQVLVAAVLATLITYTMGFKTMRTQASLLLLASILTFAISQFWFLLSDNSASRAGSISDLLEPSLYGFSMNWPFFIWGIFGSLWLIVLLVVTALRTKTMMVTSLLLLIGVPLIAGSLTLDGFRVLALVALPVTMILIGFFVDSLNSKMSMHPFVTCAVLTLVIITPPAESAWSAIGPSVYDFLAQFAKMN